MCILFLFYGKTIGKLFQKLKANWVAKRDFHEFPLYFTFSVKRKVPGYSKSLAWEGPEWCGQVQTACQVFVGRLLCQRLKSHALLVSLSQTPAARYQDLKLRPPFSAAGQ